MLYHKNSATLLKEDIQQGCAEAPRISPALITLYVHTGVSLEDAIGSCSVTHTAATVSV